MPTTLTSRMTSFTVNGRIYDPPACPVVVICIDGGSDEYLNAALLRGFMPHTAALIAGGFRGVARGALPSFTNVNNCAMVSGAPPRITGIGGNYILDPATGKEVMTNSSQFFRCDTILAAASRAGRKVAMVTAKDKLRELLSKDMHGIAFSAEKAGEAMQAVHGIDGVTAALGPAPAIYSADASLYVLRAGVWLLETGRADFLYLSLTDYMQHCYAPDEPQVLAFYESIDEQIGRLRAFDPVIGITADHGMNAKCDASGQPKVIYLESELTQQFGEGVRVILPITDPYVAHHGALGSAAMVYLPPALDVTTVASWILRQTGVTEVLAREAAVDKCELPGDRIGDLFVLSDRNTCLGRTPRYHDLSQLHGSLRSHGGRYEEMVPFIFSQPLEGKYARLAACDPRNFDIFDFACNGVRR